LDVPRILGSRQSPDRRPATDREPAAAGEEGPARAHARILMEAEVRALERDNILGALTATGWTVAGHRGSGQLRLSMCMSTSGFCRAGVVVGRECPRRDSPRPDGQPKGHGSQTGPAVRSAVGVAQDDLSGQPSVQEHGAAAPEGSHDRGHLGSRRSEREKRQG
jgi:hypothetical protein